MLKPIPFILELLEEERGDREPGGAEVVFDKIDESTLTGAVCGCSEAGIAVEAAASLPQERFLTNLQMTQVAVLF
jgi:hypothetical protein